MLRQWREQPLLHCCFRPQAWTLLALAELERRAGAEAAAVDCLDEARRRFAALGDRAGLAWVDAALSRR